MNLIPLSLQEKDPCLRGAAAEADASRMKLRDLRSIRLIRAELHLCLLC